MKANIHPQWNQINVTCACGNTFTTGSTKSDITTDICSQCHPFFTGEMKFVDVQGRVEKFQAKHQAAQNFKSGTKNDKKTVKKKEERPSTLREMLLKEQQKLQKQETKS